MGAAFETDSYAELLASLNDNLDEQQVRKILDRQDLGSDPTFEELLEVHSDIAVGDGYSAERPTDEVGGNSTYQGEQLDCTAVTRTELERRSQVQGKALEELERGLEYFFASATDLDDEAADLLVYQFDTPELDNLDDLTIEVEDHAVDIYQDEDHLFHDMTPQHCLDLEKDGNYLVENTGEYEARLNNGLLSIEVPVTYTDPHAQQDY